MFLLTSKDGEALIAKALGQFEALKQTLAEGVEKIKEKVISNKLSIEELQKETSYLNAVAVKANNAINGIEKLLNGN